jgi:hypothetical protein
VAASRDNMASTPRLQRRTPEFFWLPPRSKGRWLARPDPTNGKPGSETRADCLRNRPVVFVIKSLRSETCARSPFLPAADAGRRPLYRRATAPFAD